MPESSSHSGHTRGPSIPAAKRHAILALHWFTNKLWMEISTDLKVHPDSARHLCRCAKVCTINTSFNMNTNLYQEWTPDPEDFEAVLMVIGTDIDRAGMGLTEKISEGSAEFQALAKLTLKDEEHYRKPSPEIAKELGISAARSTIENVMHNHHAIFRYHGRKKPGLDDEHWRNRVNFADMALHMSIKAIVFTDEMWVEFNSVQHEGNVSRPKGANAYNYAIHHDFNPTTIHVMFWGCMAYSYKGPYHIWEKDDEEAKKRHADILEDINQKQRRLHNKQVARAHIPGTKEVQIVEEFNANIDRIKIQEGRTGQHKRQHKKPEHIDEFKYRDLTWQSKGGINWISYQEKILQTLLYPFIDHLQHESGEPVTYLVEDNAPAHTTAQNVDAETHQERGIITFNWPSKSPGLNKIEPIWDYEKDEIATYQFTGASQATVEEAKATLQKVWEELPQEYIDHMCMDFHNKCELVIKNKGDNNFDG